MKPPTPDNPHKPEPGMLAAPGAGAAADAGAVILPGPGYVPGAGAVVDISEPDADRPRGADTGESSTAASDSLGLSLAGQLARLAELYTLDNKDDIERYISDNQDLLDPLIEIHPKVKAYPEVIDISLELCLSYEGEPEELFILAHININDTCRRHEYADEIDEAVLKPLPGDIDDRLTLAAE